ncbi:uncharacterized protein KQ657_000615 [Scheffersomyces spartinae]|uniref:Bacteriophage T5 Orf172 DNA-binding domain-containing protein n=1 Tax=Scheffersomyces spartinae TaxID=45513 RepID=A0A9P8AIW3_9ASCO|nr:uncharacterized protein KQ657_000615 [Scheffersomyces spartinae]KAG7193546.1 hypothetical protein KQ657_000615 [Scheffersomyces spartinae]
MTLRATTIRVLDVLRQPLVVVVVQRAYSVAPIVSGTLPILAHYHTHSSDSHTKSNSNSSVLRPKAIKQRPLPTETLHTPELLVQTSVPLSFISEMPSIEPPKGSGASECFGVTLKGNKCKNKTSKGSQYCWRHQAEQEFKPPHRPQQPTVAASTPIGVSKPANQHHYHTIASTASVAPAPSLNHLGWWRVHQLHHQYESTVSALTPSALVSDPMMMSHSFNRPPATPPSPLKNKKKMQQKGHIYCYTLTNYIDTKAQDQLVIHIQNEPGTEYKKVKISRSPFILIKIGRTTKPVKTRLKQWEAHCKHELTCLTPFNHRELLHQHGIKGTMKNLLSAMERVALNDNFIASKFPTFQDDGFYCESHLDDIEKEIHRQLRDRYGQSKVFCKGCYEENVATVGATAANAITIDAIKAANVHVEWFLVPKIEMARVFRIIHKIVKQTGG